MSILQKHVAREILVPFAIAFIALTFLMLVGELFHQLSDRFMGKGLTLADLALLTFYVLPSLVVYTLPIALLLATLLAFVQLSQDLEITAMKAAGVPLRKAFSPAVAIGIVTALALLFLWAEAAPWSRRQLREFVIKTILNKPTLVLNEQTWTQEVNDMRIFVGEIDERRMRLRDVNIQVSKAGEPHRSIMARSGRLYVGGDRQRILLELRDGAIHEYDMRQPDQYSTTAFQSLTVPVNIEAVNRYIDRYHALDHVRKKEMSLLRIMHTLNEPATDPEERHELFEQIGKRTALAFMPLAFVLIGAPLGIIPHKARRFYGPLLCAGLVLAYYSLLIFGETLSEKAVFNPLIAMWIPNLLLGASGVGFMIRAERQ